MSASKGSLELYSFRNSVIDRSRSNCCHIRDVKEIKRSIVDNGLHLTCK